MNIQSKRLLPYRVYDEADVIVEYALDGTGDLGQFVKVAAADLDDESGIVDDSFGADFDRVSSPRWGSKNSVTLITSGDTKAEVLGITLKNTWETDENGQLLKFNKQKKEELFAVISGEPTQIVGKGRFHLGPEAFQVTGSAPSKTNLPNVKDLVVPSNTSNGVVDIVPKAKIVATPSGVDQYSSDQILGSVIATGSKHGGTVVVKLDI